MQGLWWRNICTLFEIMALKITFQALLETAWIIICKCRACFYRSHQLSQWREFILFLCSINILVPLSCLHVQNHAPVANSIQLMSESEISQIRNSLSQISIASTSFSNPRKKQTEFDSKMAACALGPHTHTSPILHSLKLLLSIC